MWKKVLCMALCFVMVGSVAACGDKGKDKNSSSDGTSISDTASDTTSDSTEGTSSGGDNTDYAAAAKQYMDGAVATLENAKSVKITLNQKLSGKNEILGQDGQVDETLTETEDETSKIEIVISEDGDDVAISVVTTEVYDSTIYNKEDDTETEVVATSVTEEISKGGVDYSRHYYYNDAMTETEIAEAKATDWTTIENIGHGGDVVEVGGGLPTELIQKILATKEVGDAVTVLIESLNSSMAGKLEASEVTDGTFTWAFDYTDEVNAMYAWVNGIDEANQTVSEVVNEVLGKVKTGLTIEAIIGTIKAYKGKTVAQALTDIDTLLGEDYETSLQAIKDALVNTELAGVIMKDAMGMEDEDIAAVKAWKFDSLKAEGMGEAIVGDLLNGMLIQMVSAMSPTPEADATPVDYLAQYIQMVEEMLTMKIAELPFAADEEGNSLPFEIPEIPMEYLALSGSITAKFNATTYALESIKGSVDNDMKMTYKMDDVVMGYATQDMDISFEVTEISTTPVTINAPTNVKKVIICEGYFDEAETLKIDAEEYGINAVTYYVYDANYVWEEDPELPCYIIWFYTSGNNELKYDTPITLGIADVGAWNNAALGYDGMYALPAYWETVRPTVTLTLKADGTYTITGILTIDQMIEWYNSQNNAE